MAMQPGRAIEAELRPSTAARAQISFKDRLDATPHHAEIRGVFFHLVERAMEEAAPQLRRASRTLRRAYAMYPVREFSSFVWAAACASDTLPERAIERWHARAMHHLLGSGVARLFLRRADHAPLPLLHRLERSRALLASYGRWRVSGREGDVHIEVRDEWIWLREAWVPAIASIFGALDRSAPRIDCDLDGPFSARMRVRW